MDKLKFWYFFKQTSHQLQNHSEKQTLILLFFTGNTTIISSKREQNFSLMCIELIQYVKRKTKTFSSILQNFHMWNSNEKHISIGSDSFLEKRTK